MVLCLHLRPAIFINFLSSFDIYGLLFVTIHRLTNKLFIDSDRMQWRVIPLYTCHILIWQIVQKDKMSSKNVKQKKKKLRNCKLVYILLHILQNI